MKCEVSFSTIANFLSSGVWALNSGVMYVSGRSSKRREKGVGVPVVGLLPASDRARISRTLSIARNASSNP